MQSVLAESCDLLQVISLIVYFIGIFSIVICAAPSVSVLGTSPMLELILTRAWTVGNHQLESVLIEISIIYPPVTRDPRSPSVLARDHTTSGPSCSRVSITGKGYGMVLYTVIAASRQMENSLVGQGLGDRWTSRL